MKSVQELTDALAQARRHYQAIIDTHDMLKEVGGMERLYTETQQRLRPSVELENEHKARLSGIQTQIDTASARLTELQEAAKITVSDADTEALRVVDTAKLQAASVVESAKSQSAALLNQRSQEHNTHNQAINEKKEIVAALNADIEAKKLLHAQWQGKIDEAKKAVADVLAPLTKTS